jgi:hypothetical protein
MAGTEAETVLLGAAQGGDGEDLRHIAMLAEQIADRCDLNRLRRMTRMLVRRHRKRIKRVAKALLAKEALTEKQIDKLAARSIADLPHLHMQIFQGLSGELITVTVERRVKARGRNEHRQRTERELMAAATRKAQSIMRAQRQKAPAPPAAADTGRH